MYLHWFHSICFKGSDFDGGLLGIGKKNIISIKYYKEIMFCFKYLVWLLLTQVELLCVFGFILLVQRQKKVPIVAKTGAS